MEHSEQLDQLAAALSMAQGEFPPIKKTKEGQLGNRKYLYADLADIKEATRGPLAKHGLAVISAPELVQTEFRLASKLLHKSGQWIASTYPLPGGLTAQETGSAITYARRYVVSALLDIVTEDDDDGAAAGEAQTKRGNGKATPSKPAEPPKKGPEKPKEIDRSRLVTVELTRVIRRDVETGTRYGLEFRTEEMDTPEWLNTFNDTMGHTAKKLLDEQQLANVIWEKGKIVNGKPSLVLLHIESA